MHRQVIHCTVTYCRYNVHEFCALDSIQISTQTVEMVDGQKEPLPPTFCASYEEPAEP